MRPPAVTLNTRLTRPLMIKIVNSINVLRRALYFVLYHLIDDVNISQLDEAQ